ncbi:MAG: hypothetical protein AMXMBFR23_25240 [Chloroflexota bacterium]
MSDPEPALDRDSFLALDPETASASQIARHLASVDQEDALIQRVRLGAEGSFEGARNEIERAIALAREMSSLPLDSLQGTRLYDRLQGPLRELCRVLIAVAKFDPNQTQPQQERQRLQERIASETGNARDQFADAAGYLVLKSGGLGDSSARLDSAIEKWTANAQSAIDGQREQLSAAASEARSAVEAAAAAKVAAESAATAAQRAAGSAGVAKYAGVFKTEADSYKAQARSALTAGFAGAVVLVLVTVLLVWIPTGGDDIGNPRVVQLILIKSLIVGFGAYLVLLAFRLYRTREHLRVINQHRHSALLTFEAFVTATDNPSTRDAVLIEATRAIFAPGTTGLLAEEGGNGSLSVLEVFRQLSPSKSNTD